MEVLTWLIQAGQSCFGEQPSAAKWNILGANDASFNDGTGIGTDAIKASQMFYGMVRNRQGGTTGDASWASSGTSNTATDAKDVFIQVGYTTTSGSGATSVTFPTAYTYPPLVFVNVNSGTNGFWAQCDSVPTTTGFTVTAWSTTSLLQAKLVSWMAIGQ